MTNITKDDSNRLELMRGKSYPHKMIFHQILNHGIDESGFYVNGLHRKLTKTEAQELSNVLSKQAGTTVALRPDNTMVVNEHMGGYEVYKLYYAKTNSKKPNKTQIVSEKVVKVRIDEGFAKSSGFEDKKKFYVQIPVNGFSLDYEAGKEYLMRLEIFKHYIEKLNYYKNGYKAGTTEDMSLQSSQMIRSMDKRPDVDEVSQTSVVGSESEGGFEGI